MARLEYNGHAEEVCIDDVSIVRTSIPHPATGAVLGHRETWTIQGTRIGDTASLVTQVAALETAYASDGHDIKLKTTAGGTTLNEMLTASAAQGVRITQRPSFPTLQGAEWATKRKYTIVAEAELFDGNPSLLLDDQTWDYQTGQDGKTRRTVSGKLRTKNGTSASAQFAGKDPGTPAGYTRGAKGYNKNHNDTEIGWQYLDQEHWVALPAGVKEGAYTRTTQLTGGSQTLTIAGRFVGPDVSVDAAISALLLPGLKLVSRDTVREPFSGATSFSLVYDQSLGSLEWQESVRITSSSRRQIYQEVLGGDPPVRQEGAKTTAKASVSGRAVGRDTYPAFPPDLYPAMYLVEGSPQKSYDGPKRTADGKYLGYGISWQYDYEFPTNQSTRLPRVR